MADINNIKIENKNINNIMFSDYYVDDTFYKFDFTEWTDTKNAILNVTKHKIIITKFKPNVWLLHSPNPLKGTNCDELCNYCRGTRINVTGLSKNSNLFKSYYVTSTSTGAGSDVGKLKGLCFYPFSTDGLFFTCHLNYWDYSGIDSNGNETLPSIPNMNYEGGFRHDGSARNTYGLFNGDKKNKLIFPDELYGFNNTQNWSYYYAFGLFMSNEDAISLVDDEGYIDISDNPISIELLVYKGIDVSTTECWEAYCNNTKIWNKDKTNENCLKKYGLLLPYGYRLYPSRFENSEYVEWLTPIKFKIKKVTSSGISINNKVSLDYDSYNLLLRKFDVKVTNMPSNVIGNINRKFENITEENDSEIELLNNEIVTVQEFNKTIYRKASGSPMTYYEAQFNFMSNEGDIDTNIIVDIIPEFKEDERTTINTNFWKGIHNEIVIPETVDINDLISKGNVWQMKPYNLEIWETIKTWYENNDAPISKGYLFDGSARLKEITIRIPNYYYNYGEDNFRSSEIETINFVQSGENSHISSPQRLLRSAIKLKNINITWAGEPSYICGANSIVDGMSYLGVESIPERFICWGLYRSHISTETYPCTLFQYAFSNSSLLKEIPSFPTEDESLNTILPSRNCSLSFNQCKSLVKIGPILDLRLVNPEKSDSMFSNCVSLSSVKIKNLNHGDWSFDGETRNGVFIGTLESLDSESVKYLIENLTDLNTYDPKKHIDNITTSFRKWNSEYFDIPTNKPGWDYTLETISKFACKKRYDDADLAPFIVSTNEALIDMPISIYGLQEGDIITFGENGKEPIITFSYEEASGLADLTKTISKEAGAEMGFKFINNNSGITNVVYIAIIDGLDYTNPNVNNAKIYCPQSWSDKISDDLTSIATSKGWTLVI